MIGTPSRRHVRALIAACTVALSGATTLFAQVLTTADLYPRGHSSGLPPGAASDPHISLDRDSVSLRSGSAEAIEITVHGSATLHGRTRLTVRPFGCPVIAAFDPSEIDVPDGGLARSTMTITVPDDVAAGDFLIELSAATTTASASTYLPLKLADRAVLLLPQGTAEMVTRALDRPVLALQALEVRFGASAQGSIALRTTMSVRHSQPTAAGRPLRPSEDLRRSLVDPRGGWLAASVGWQWSHVAGSRWSFDAGGTGRFLELPDTNPPEEPTQSSVGIVTSGGGHVRFAAAGGQPDSPVTLCFVGGYEIGALLPDTAAKVFAVPLDRMQQRAVAAAALWVRPAHFYFSGEFRWSSDAQLGHHIALGLTVVP